MELVSIQHGRSEQKLAAARVVVALLVLAVLGTDPSIAGRYARPLTMFVGLYAFWSLSVLVWVWTAILHTQRARVLSHVVDVAAGTILVGATQSPVSPLFPLAILSLFSAALRFGPRGISATGIVTAALYAGVTSASGALTHDTAFVVSRLAYIGFTTLLLAYMRAHEQRIQRELTQLAAWPRRGLEQRDTLVRDALEFAAGLLHAPRVAAVFDQADEPWLWIALRDENGFTITAEAPDTPVLTESAEDLTFFCSDVKADVVQTVVARDNRVETVANCLVDPRFMQRLGMRSVLSAPFSGEAVQGRLFFLDAEGLSFGEMTMSRIVGHLFAARLDEFALLDSARTAAVAEERVRLARDLHDTLLQSLTAMALQLESAVNLMQRDPATAQQRVRAVQELIAKDQTELRSFIAQLRPMMRRPIHPPLAVRLQELPIWFLQQWDTIVSVDMQPAEANVPEPMATDIIRAVNEAVANAAKHARASRVSAVVTLDDSTARIVVSDDGRGMPFRGTYDLERLNEENRGPRTLRERIASVGGTMLLTSTDSGTTIEITMPIGEGRRPT